jgi:flagellar biosynthesis protein FlhF
MKMKSFFAPTVQDAMEQARREMGPEALLINSRKAPPEAQGLGEYEVVFAVVPARTDGMSQLSNSVRSEAPPEDPVIRELARLRKQVEEMGSALTGINAHAFSWAVPAPEFAEAFSRLIENDFSIEVAKRIVKQAHSRLDSDPASWLRRKMPFDSESIERAVRLELENLVCVDPNLGISEGKANVVALVGPPGCGKTTTLVKLAVRYGLASSQPVHLISADNRRIAAAEQLRTYASIIGAGFDAVETARSLQQTLEAQRENGLILVDTQGYGEREMDDAAAMAQFLKHQPGVEVHAVVQASMRAADLSRTLDRFEIFSPAKLIFTHVDETSSFGAMVSESARSGRPISFLATGQQIPEDLEPATINRLLEPVVERSGARALSAA